VCVNICIVMFSGLAWHWKVEKYGRTTCQWFNVELLCYRITIRVLLEYWFLSDDLIIFYEVFVLKVRRGFNFYQIHFISILFKFISVSSIKHLPRCYNLKAIKKRARSCIKICLNRHEEVVIWLTTGFQAMQLKIESVA